MIPADIIRRNAARFWANVDPGRSLFDCWEWTASGAGRRQRYGNFQLWVDGRKQAELAHRAAYMLAVGDIAPGMVLDHVAERGCRSTRCCNPAHLEPVSNRENLRRAKQAGIPLGARARRAA